MCGGIKCAEDGWNIVEAGTEVDERVWTVRGTAMLILVGAFVEGPAEGFMIQLRMLVHGGSRETQWDTFLVSFSNARSSKE